MFYQSNVQNILFVNRNVLYARWLVLDTTGDPYVRVSHLLRYFLSFKGILLTPDASLISIFNEMYGSCLPSNGIFQTLQTVVTFEDFVELWCRLCISQVWRSGNPATESQSIACDPDQIERSRVISEPNTTQPSSSSLSTNLHLLFTFMTGCASSSAPQ